MFHDPDFTPFTPNERPSWRSTKRNFLENWPPAAYREHYFTLQGVWPFVGRTHYLTDPELIEDMLITRAESFTRDFITIGALSSVINRDALFFVEGADWRWQRRALAPAFRHENLLALTPTFVDCAKAQAEAWRLAPQGAPVDAMNAMSNVTFAVIEKAVLGVTGAFDRGKFVAALQESFAAISWSRIFTLLRLPTWLPFPGSLKVNRDLRYLYDETARLLAARRASGGQAQAILDRLLAAKDPESGRSMTDAELIANLYGFLVAGHETSAVALGWSLWLLAKDQASQERLRDEERAIAGDADIGPETVEKLQFTKQVIQESMRLFPPAAAIGRQPREDTTLGPHKIAKSEPVYAALWALPRHEKLWDAPNAFDPDRFAPEKAKARHRCAYMPFGAGPRICIGMGFAMLEMTAILATLVRDFRFTPVEGHRLELAPDFTTRPKGGLPLIIEKI
ncbi:MAG: cytochrome P450 [Methylocystis sp.]|nr:cytochrome P450 [Methylocystis sp.]